MARRFLWGAGAGLAAVPLIGLAWWPGAGAGLLALLLLIVVLGASQPLWAVAVVAAALPLGLPLLVITDTTALGLPGYAESLVLACLAGSCVHEVTQPPLAVRTGAPAIIVALLCLTGGLVTTVVPFALPGWPEWINTLLRHFALEWFADAASFPALHTGLVWALTALLVPCVERAVRRSPSHQSLPADATRWGLAALAGFSALRLAEISLASGDVWMTALGHLRTSRLSPHLPDVNATGSWLVLGVGLWTWTAHRRTVTLSAVRAWLGVLVCVCGVWLTGSRSAQAAALLALVLPWVAAGLGRRALFGLAGAVTVGLATLALWNPGRQAQSGVSEALGVRGDMAAIGVQVLAQAPVFGVGPDQFKDASIPHVSAELAARFPQTRVGENAHNQVIQIVAEWGALGGAAMAWLLWTALGGRRRGDNLSVGWVGAWLAFAVSALLGHPWLMPTVLVSTWMIAGAAAAFRPPSIAGRSGVAIAIAAGILLCATLPWRAQARLHGADLEHYRFGASPIVGERDGVPYHLAEQTSRWFIRRTATLVDIPLRADSGSVPCTVRLAVDEVDADVVTVDDSTWRHVRFRLIGDTGTGEHRIDLRTSPADCRLWVGRLTVVD